MKATSSLPLHIILVLNPSLSLFQSSPHNNHIIAKRMGWDGATLSPRLFSGAVHYYTSDKVLDLGDGVELLPEGIVRYVFLCVFC